MFAMLLFTSHGIPPYCYTEPTVPSLSLTAGLREHHRGGHQEGVSDEPDGARSTGAGPVRTAADRLGGLGGGPVGTARRGRGDRTPGGRRADPSQHRPLQSASLQGRRNVSTEHHTYPRCKTRRIMYCRAKLSATHSYWWIWIQNGARLWR